MAGSDSSKGNGASKRMSNVKLKEKRARSWARGEKRKKARREANEARMQANLDALKALGGTRQAYERVTEQRTMDPKSGLVVVKTVTRTKQESPGTALARTKREAR